VVRVVVVAQFFGREVVALLEGDCEFAHNTLFTLPPPIVSLTQSFPQYV
jgi:hypothetical protein